MLGSAEEEIKKSDDIWGSANIKALREQQEKHFDLSGPYKFTMPTTEGQWDSVTSTLSRTVVTKLMGLLGNASLKLFIDVDDATRAKRASISKTEQFAIGALDYADRKLTSVPSGKSIQSSLVWYAGIAGGTAKSVLIYTEQDKTPGKKGKVCPDVKIYDPEQCQWLEGDGELIWFCHRRMVSKAYVGRTYPKAKLSEDGWFNRLFSAPKNDILMRTFWDSDEWKIAIGSEYVDGEVHNLGHVPVNIRTCGHAPEKQSEETEDTMRFSWQGIFFNDENIYDEDSKMLSLKSSRAVRDAKITAIGSFDSSKSLNVAEDVKKLGFKGTGDRNEFVFLDEAKGQTFKGMVQLPPAQVLESYHQLIMSRATIATIAPVTYGQMQPPGSGILAAQLRSSSLEFVNPIKQCVEADLQWLAEELVSQFKNGEFDAISLEGRDSKRNKFYAENLTPQDIEEKRFECQLVLDNIRDETIDLGNAIQKVKSGLTSLRTARIQGNIVQDPDREQDIMDEELAAQTPFLRYDKMAKYWKDQGNDRYALAFMALSALEIERVIKEAIAKGFVSPELPGGNGEKPLIPEQTLTPQTEAGRIAAEPRQIIRNTEAR